MLGAERHWVQLLDGYRRRVKPAYSPPLRNVVRRLKTTSTGGLLVLFNAKHHFYVVYTDYGNERQPTATHSNCYSHVGKTGAKKVGGNSFLKVDILWGKTGEIHF